MEIFNRLESKRFELPQVKSSVNVPMCDYCKKREAEYECEQCEKETGEPPIRFICERHLERIRKHEEPNRHNYRKIEEYYSEESLVDLMDTSNVHISCITGQLAQLKGELGEAKERIEDHFQRLIQSFTEEVNLHKEKCIREIDNEVNKKKNELLSQKSTLERIVEGIQALRDREEAEKTEENSKENEEANKAVKNTQNQIYDNAQRAKQYRPSAGPFFRLQPFDESIKRLVRQVIDYDIVTEPIDFNKLKEVAGMTKPLVAGHHFPFTAQDVPNWCLRDCPVIMLPHPDLKANGKLARKLLELQCTAAVESSLVERTTQVYDIHGCCLLKCGDGISRRVILRKIDDDVEDKKAERNVIELFSPTITANQATQKDLVKIENAIEKHMEECASIYSERHREMLQFPQVAAMLDPLIRGTYKRGVPSGMCKFDLKLKNQVSLLLAVQILKELTAKGKELETISWAIRAKYFLFFVDETQMAPIPIDLNLPDPLKDLELYGIIDDIDLDSIRPLAIECWVNLKYTNEKDLRNCEPFSSKFQSPDVSAALRTFLDDAKEFKVEFMASIDGTESTNAWLTNVTANKENIADKVRSYLDVRSHFTVPRKSS